MKDSGSLDLGSIPNGTSRNYVKDIKNNPRKNTKWTRKIFVKICVDSWIFFDSNVVLSNKHFREDSYDFVDKKKETCQRVFNLR